MKNITIFTLFLLIPGVALQAMDAPFLPDATVTEFDFVPFETELLFPIEQMIAQSEPKSSTEIQPSVFTWQPEQQADKKKTPTSYICQFPSCGAQFDLRAPLKTHIYRYHIRLQPYECPVPNCKKFYTHQEVEAHIRDNHSDQPKLIASEISKETKVKIKKAIDQYMPSLPFKCKDCSDSFLTKKVLTIHINIKHLKKTKAKPKAESSSNPKKRDLAASTSVPAAVYQHLTTKFKFQKSVNFVHVVPKPAAQASSKKPRNESEEKTEVLS